jgi:hypothetical protein
MRAIRGRRCAPGLPEFGEVGKATMPQTDVRSRPCYLLCRDLSELLDVSDGETVLGVMR